MRWFQLKTIQSWLNLEPDELKPAGLCFTISFTWGFSQMLSWTAANTLFLQYYDSKDLPIISIASAVLIPLSGLLFLQLNRWLRYSSQFLVFALLFVAAPLLFRFLLGIEGWRWPSLGFAIWYYLEVAFAALLMDSLVNRLFNLRQVKRVFGPISTGSDMAGVPAGFLVALMVKESGVENLLLVAAAVSSIVLFLFIYVERSYRPRMLRAADPAEEGQDEDTGPSMPLLSLFRHPLVLCILAIEALSEFNLEFINNAFYSRTELYLTQPEEMASFLGQFFAIASIFSSVIQMLASSRLMRLIGIGGCLVVGPVIVGIMLLVFVTSSLLGFAPAFVFGCMAGAKFVQYTVLVNVNDVAQFTLIRSLSPELQDRVLALSGTVMAPLLGGLSGLVLLGMIHLLGATAVGISMVVLCILAVVILIGFRAAREYRRNLHQILTDRAITGIELPLNDPGTSQTLLSLVRSPDVQTALCSLELLSQQAHSGLKPALAEALRHPDTRVRRRAAILYQGAGSREDLPVLSQSLAAEQDALVVAELLPAVASAGRDRCQEVLQRYLQHPNPLVVQGACVGLIRHCGDTGRHGAGQMLTDMSGSTEAGRRAFVAESLGKIGPSALDGLLIPLLADADLEVRKKAIEAAGRLRHPGLGAALLDNLDHPELRPMVVKALILGSDTMLPSIDRLFDEPGQQHAMKQTILRIYGRIRSASSIALLKKRLGEIDRELQREVVMALAQCRYRPREGEREILESLIQQYCACATWLLACTLEINPHRNKELLGRALDHELRKIKDLIFMLLDFLYSGESIGYIRFAYFHSKSEDKVAAAVELLDNILSSRHREYLLPILEETSLDRRLTDLEKMFPLEEGGMIMRLVEIMNGRYSAPNPWLQAVTLDFASQSASLAGVAEICRDDEVLDRTRQWLKPSAPVPGTDFRGLSVIDKVAALKRAPIFSEVPDEILADYASATVEQYFPKGASIIRQGEKGSTLCLIVQGRVRIHTGAQTIAEMSEGDIFGELSALSPEPRSANVDAVTDTRLLVMSAETIEKMISERAEAAQGIIRVLCQRIQATIRHRTYEDTGPFRIPTAGEASETGTISTAVLQDVEKAVLLKTVEIFSFLPDTVLMHLASLAREQRLDAGATLFRQGDFGTSMFVIVDGEVAVHDEDRLIATLRRGEIIGELALLTSELRSSSVTATRATRFLKITQSAIGELMWDHARMVRSLIQVLAVRLRRMTSG